MNNMVINGNLIQKLPSVPWENKDALFKYAKDLKEKYKTLVFDEEKLGVAKKELAEIRKLIELTDSKRKETKKLWLANFEGFESDVKELISILGESEKSIDKQVQEFITKVKEEKRKLIINLDEYKNLGEYQYFDDRWLNKTFVLKDVATELINEKARIDGLTKSVDAYAKMNDMKPEDYIDLIKTTDLNDIYFKIDADKKTKEKIIEEIAATKEPEPINVILKTTKDNGVISVVRRLTGTKKQLEDLKFMADDIGVTWERLE